MHALEKILNFQNPDENTIPTIKLYMDQLQEYFETSLGDLKRQDEAVLLTKTMINNYVKSNLIKAPERKKYDKETIADLIIIYHLKQVFSIQDTMRILTLMKQDADYYSRFVDYQNAVRSELMTNMPNGSFDMSKEDAGALLLQLTIEVSVKKQLSEQLIDHLNAKTSVQKTRSSSSNTASKVTT